MAAKTDLTPEDMKKCVTAEAVLDAMNQCDLHSKESNKFMWKVIRPLGTKYCDQYEAYRDKYLKQGFSSGDARKKGYLDLASILPTAEALPAGLIDDMRPRLKDELEKKPFAPTNKDKKLRLTQTDRIQSLVKGIRARKDASRVSLPACVEWVSENLLIELADLRADDIPSVQALTMLKWARSNESEYRRTYDSKRIPAKGFVSETDSGYVDDGTAIEEVFEVFKKGFADAFKLRRVQEGHQSGDLVSTCSGQETGGSMPELYSATVSGEAGTDSGAPDGEVRDVG